MHAGSLILAPRMPPPPQRVTGRPWDEIGDVVIDCGVPGCTWHAMGARSDAKKAWDAHNALCHVEQTGVILINSPRQ